MTTHPGVARGPGGRIVTPAQPAELPVMGSNSARARRALRLLSVMFLVLACSVGLASPARAADPSPAQPVEIRPVDVVSEEVIAEEKAEDQTDVVDDDPERLPDACDAVGTHYKVFKKKDRHIPIGIEFKDGPGGLVKASIQHKLAVTLSVSLGATFKAGAIIASAETTFNITASVTAEVTQTHEYQHKVPKKKFGHLRYGNWGWRMGVQKYVINSNCKVTSRTNGTVRAMPSAFTWGYRYWTTKS